MFKDSGSGGFRLDRDQCLAIGFHQTGTVLTYQEPLLEDDLQLRLEISAEGQLSVTVWDTLLNEAYESWRVVTPLNAYAQKIKEAVEAKVLEIREQCFQEIPLKSAQGQRLFDWLQVTFEDSWDHPFSRLPDATAFRLPESGKWYALAISLDPAKLATHQEEKGETVIEVLNLKVPSQTIIDLTKQAGIYPAYHMSKKHWITLSLDDKLPDATIQSLLEQSRHLVLGKK